MKFFNSVLGFTIAGILVMSIWDGLAGPYGIAGGYAAAIILIGPLWYLNHNIGLINNKPGDAFVDMALGIGIAGIARDIFLADSMSIIIDTIPTFVLVALGGILGGICVAYVERSLDEDKEKPQA